MRTRPPLRAVLLAALIVLAGCAGPLSSDGSTATDGNSAHSPTAVQTDAGAQTTDGDGSQPTDARSADASDEIGVNATTVFQRVERLMNVTGTQPTFEVSERSGDTAIRPGVNMSDVWDRCGPELPFFSRSVDPSLGSSDAVELSLASMFADELLSEVETRDQFELSRRNGSTLNTTLLHVLDKGSSLYVAEAYAEEYDLRIGDERPLAVYRCFDEEVPSLGGTTDSYFGAPYYGARYVDQRIDDPSRLDRIYESPPATTEQLIHGEIPQSEPPVPLRVTVANGDDVDADERLRRGELQVRNWLQYGPWSAASEVTPGDRAVDAAAGWGNDERLTFETASDAGSSHAWVIRWDDADEADEFEATLAESRSALTDREDFDVRLERVAPETTVVIYGGESFVANANASGTNGNVTVSVAD